MRIQRPVPADAAFQTERIGIGRQQQLDRGGVETDAVVEPLHAVLRVDALDGHHRHQHLDLADLRGVPGEERLDHVRRRRRDDYIDPTAGMSTRGNRIDALVDLRDHDAAAERGRLDDRRGVLGVRAGVEIALGIGRLRRDQAHLRRQVDEVACEEFEVGVDRADLHAAGRDELREPAALRSREREVESRRDAVLEHVEVLRQGQHRLHHVEVVDARRIGAAPAPRRESRPASGCCLRGRLGRRARAPRRAARRCGRSRPTCRPAPYRAPCGRARGASSAGPRPGATRS